MSKGIPGHIWRSKARSLSIQACSESLQAVAAPTSKPNATSADSCEFDTQRNWSPRMISLDTNRLHLWWLGYRGRSAELILGACLAWTLSAERLSAHLRGPWRR